MDRFAQLLVDVDTAFDATAHGLRRWPDPHPDRSPLEEEYSRLLDPGKWRIVGARVDAWIEALVAAGLAEVQHDVSVDWAVDSGTDVHRTDRVSPRRDGALPLIVTRNQLGGVEGAGVTIGAGDPAVAVEMIPDCGCDACDSGSQDVLDQVDDCIGGIVRGEFRHLWRQVKRRPLSPRFRFRPLLRQDGAPGPAATWALPGLQTITVPAAGRHSARNVPGRSAVDAALADPTGWHETTGAPWFT